MSRHRSLTPACRTVMRVAREIATPGAAGDAQFSLLLDGKRCVLRFMIALMIGLAASVNGVTVAAAQTYPQRAVKFILPFGPSARTHTTAPLLADQLDSRAGTPV